jgi:hypothetical protein
MAKVQVQIVVSKVAENGDYKGRVISGWESFNIQVKGEQISKKRQWTMWLDAPSEIAKDDVVTFTGDLGTKAGSFEKDGQTYQVVEHSLNNVSFTINSKGAPVAAKNDDGWNTPPSTFTANAPF